MQYPSKVHLSCVFVRGVGETVSGGTFLGSLEQLPVTGGGLDQALPTPRAGECT